MSNEFEEFVESIPEPEGEKATALWDLLPEELQGKLLDGAEYYFGIMNERNEKGITIPLNDRQASDLYKLCYLILLDQGIIQRITGAMCQVFCFGGAFAMKTKVKEG